ncbi:MAG: hypothetical protein ACRDZU_08370 [Acidimicrobiales bacterium]
MRRLSVLWFVAVCAVLGAACGDDDGGGGDALSSDEQAFADAWAATLSDSDEDGLTFDDDEAQCMGDALMAEIGTEPFDDAGLEPGDIDSDGAEDDSPGELLGAGVISDAQADAVLATWDGCTDLNAAFVQLVAAEAELDDEARECIVDGVEDGDLVSEGFKASLTSDDSEPPEEVVTALVTLMSTCGGDESGQGGLIVDSIAGSLAADGRLDAEQSQCIAQEMVDAIGLDRLIELGMGGGDFASADPDLQQEMASAVLSAAEACDVPISALGG